MAAAGVVLSITTDSRIGQALIDANGVEPRLTDPWRDLSASLPSPGANCATIADRCFATASKGTVGRLALVSLNVERHTIPSPR